MTQANPRPDRPRFWMHRLPRRRPRLPLSHAEALRRLHGHRLATWSQRTEAQRQQKASRK